MTLASTAPLKIIAAIIYETFRMYAPISIALPRMVHRDGATVEDTCMPQDTKIGISQFATYRSMRSFTNSEECAPARLLNDTTYTRQALNPSTILIGHAQLHRPKLGLG
ncbi:hypothetical protein CC86DRAFT_20345 [Ophiobolus disseminans]|uniref:Uncharacterized protein n=1 Tax=Ophiobolus disseminans TaxID=1469910 RepID=A0A6A7A0A6_9PLEO|nr:hypothetical protein CC86DRAFT_20345 [Ophiobolus disseminans]